MKLSELFELIKSIVSIPGAKTVLIFIVLSLIQISPLKIDPWSWLGSIIGGFTGIKKLEDKVDAVDKKVDKVDKKVDGLDHKVDENDVVTSRVRILRFESELQENRYHSKDSWDQTMQDVIKYEKYVSDHPEFKNGITEPTIEHIREEYKERLVKHDWDKKK